MCRKFFYACSFKNFEDGWKWALAGVYGPNLHKDKSLLWEDGFILFVGFALVYVWGFQHSLTL